MPVRPRNAARNRRAGFWRQWTLWIYFPLALLLVLAGVCLYRSGHWLVAGDSFGKVSWAVVLAGESRDVERSDAALKLYMEGRIDTTIYSATRTFKDRYGSEFMIDYLVREGYPREKLFEFRQDAYSTQEEAALLIRQFRYQNLDTVLIITSNFHSARTRRIFRKLSQGYPHVLVYPADFKDYDPSAWWSGRESRKYWLTEWMKTISTFFELMNAPPETGKSETDGLLGISSRGAPGNAADTLAAAPAPAESASAPADIAAPDSLAAPADSGAIPPQAPGEAAPDSARSASETALPKPKAPDSASEAPRKEPKISAKDTSAAKAGSAKPPAKAPAKPSKPASAKPEASKPAAKKGAAKASEKDKKKGTR